MLVELKVRDVKSGVIGSAEADLDHEETSLMQQDYPLFCRVVESMCLEDCDRVVQVEAVVNKETQEVLFTR